MRPCRPWTFLLPLALFSTTTPAQAEEPIRLRESFAAGHRYMVSSRTDLSGTLTLPAMGKEDKPRTLTVSGKSTVEYGERVLDCDAKGVVQKTVRIYDRLDYRRKVGDQPQESSLRPSARRMVVLRLKQSEVPFSPDGPLTWGEVDQVRTEVFTPALQGLLPGKDVRAGETWTADIQTVQELTDLLEIKDGKVECRLQEVAMQNGRRFALVSFAGTVTGTNEDGPNRQKLDGSFFFDLQSNHLSYLSLKGTSWILDSNGKELGKIEGQFVLTRRVEPQLQGLGDDDLRKLTLEPNADNTMLLFDEPGYGVRFTYPRRWTIQRADARQVVLEEPGGGGLLITLEPLKQTPTAKHFEAEVTGWLKKQPARVIRGDPPRKVQASPEEVERFGMEVELDKQNLWLDYYVVRQAAGGATFAGRYPLNSAAALQPEVEKIARSLRLIPPKK